MRCRKWKTCDCSSSYEMGEVNTNQTTWSSATFPFTDDDDKAWKIAFARQDELTCACSCGVEAVVRLWCCTEYIFTSERLLQLHERFQYSTTAMILGSLTGMFVQTSIASDVAEDIA